MSKDAGTIDSKSVVRLTAERVSTELKGVPFVVKQILKRIAKSRFGTLILTLPTGQTFKIGGKEPGPNAELVLNNWGLATRTLKQNSIGTAESYIDGDWTSPNPARVLEFALANWNTSGVYKRSFAANLLERYRHWSNRNSKKGSQRNIAAHYDLGNDFYSLWLDPSMTYSSAFFDNTTSDLEAGQQQKYRHLATEIGIAENHNVLEIGCGWGGFAEFAAREIGCNIKCLTISREQLDFAQERIFKAGLNEKVDLVFQDYRDENGQYDSIASIEMIEAVGEQYWNSYYETVSSSLKAGGRAGIQAITLNDADFEDYRSNPDFIQRYIFPGGMLMSPNAMKNLGDKFGMGIVKNTIFGVDYADTLAEWRVRFLAAWPKIKTMGFDENFKRMWEFYLVYCEAGFRHQSIDVRQVIYQKTA